SLGTYGTMNATGSITKPELLTGILNGAFLFINCTILQKKETCSLLIVAYTATSRGAVPGVPALSSTAYRDCPIHIIKQRKSMMTFREIPAASFFKNILIPPFVLRNYF